MSKSQRMKRVIRTGQFMLFDIFSIAMSYGITILIFMFLEIPLNYYMISIFLPIILTLKIAFYAIFGLYRMLLDHFGFEDAFKIFIAVVVSNLFLMVFFFITQVEFISWLAFIFIAPLEMIFLAIPRVAKRAIEHIKMNQDWRNALGSRTLIIGAGDGGEMVLKEIYRNKAMANIPVGFVDDNINKIGNRLSGVPIFGPISQIQTFIDQYRIEEVIIAIADMKFKKLKELISEISEKNVSIKRLPLMTEVTEGISKKIIDVRVEDLLNREEICLDTNEIHEFIKGKTVLITGGGGSIGSELARQISEYSPGQLIIFDIYENNAYEIQMELERRFHKTKQPLNLKVLIGSVYNEARLEKVFKEYTIDIVFHAAAYKHVPLMEDSPEEAIRSNVIGTYTTAYLASKYKVKNFVLVSSDKAVRPTNVMGATKRYAELIVQHFDHLFDTKYSAVRFGNVLGSNGSVIPLFKKQIEDGGPVSVTHPEITRYFMTIPESVGLILQSAVYSSGGEIFVLDMGEPVRIKTLAEKMIRLTGLKPYIDIDIEYTGLRPGEKLYEELLTDGLNNKRTNNDKIFIEDETSNGTTQFEEEIFSDYIERFETLDPKEVKRGLTKIIKSYDCTGTCD